jgi:aminopeptidase N
VTTVIRYHGEPRDGLRIQGDSLTGPTIFADNWPDRARFWLPVQDLPSDKAMVTLHIEVPAGLKAVATGALQRVDTLAYGRTVWHYRLAEPVPAYTLVLGVARFAVTTLPGGPCEDRCIPITLWTERGDSAWAAEGPFRHAGEIVDYFSRLIGPFPYPALAHVAAVSGFTSKESATAIFYDRVRFGQRTLTEQEVAHETVHQWFGDAVTAADWHHAWLSEGLATYCEALWVGHIAGDTAFRRVMAEAAAAATRDNPEVRRPILDSASTSAALLLNANSYQKAAWVLHSLRGLMGDSAFFRGIGEYYRRYRNGVALSSDFAAVMSQAAGTNLDWYFAQALRQAGYPILDVRWRLSRGRLLVEISQTQLDRWGTYRIPNLTVLVDGKSTVVNLEGRETHFVLEGFKQPPQRIAVDPDHWWLLESNVSRAP